MFAVANSRNAGCGLMTRLWSSSVRRPDDFEHALDHEHDVGAAGVVFVEHQRDIVLIGPGQDAVAEFGDLLAVADHDRILADEVDTADVAVEIDAHAWPVEPRRNLLDMGRFAGAVIAGDDHAPVAGKARQDGERGRPVEPVIGIDVRHMLVRLRIGRHLHVAVEAEDLPDGDLHVRQRRGGFGNGSHCSSVCAPARPFGPTDRHGRGAGRDPACSERPDPYRIPAPGHGGRAEHGGRRMKRIACRRQFTRKPDGRRKRGRCSWPWSSPHPRHGRGTVRRRGERPAIPARRNRPGNQQKPVFLR